MTRNTSRSCSSARKGGRRHDDWLRAFVLALGVLLGLHLFVLRFVSVESTSMFATLRPGDLLVVARWPRWTGLDRGDIVVFRDPLQDRTGLSRRSWLAKRVMAVPGDELEIRRGVVYLNGRRVHEPEGVSYSHLVRLKPGASALEFRARLGLPPEVTHGEGANIEVPLDEHLASIARADRAVESVEPMRLGQRSAQPHLPVQSALPVERR